VKVSLIAHTALHTRDVVPWIPNATDTDGDSLGEFAGRACYQSWSRPNPATATNETYLRHILDVGHHSVLEHSSATFYVDGVSRSLTHELVRHRHLSFSQLSQRYVDESLAEFVMPPALADMPDRNPRLNARDVHLGAREQYRHIVTALTDAGVSRKQAREAARSVLPNGTETKIVVTGNYRAWRHFITLRASAAADAEIRALALEILRQCKILAPNTFQDFTEYTREDGVVVASSNVTTA